MAFIDELRAANQGGGGNSYFGQPSPDNSSASDVVNGLMPLFHQVRNRNLQDFEAKSHIATNESVRQARLMQMFNPANHTNDPSQQPNVVYQPPPSELNASKATEPITPFQQAGLNLEKQKLAQSGQMGDERQDLQSKRLALDVDKNSNIRDQKENELQQKADEANRKLTLAYDQLQGRQADAVAQGQLAQLKYEAQIAQAALDAKRKDATLDETKRMHDAQIKQLQTQAEQNGYQISIQPDPNNPGQMITSFLKKGAAAKDAGTIRVIAPDGRHGDFPASEPLPPGYKKIQ